MSVMLVLACWEAPRPLLKMTIKFWDVESNEPVHAQYTGVNSIAFPSDGRHLVSGSADGTVHV